MEVSGTTAKVISNIHSAILKVSKGVQHALSLATDNQRRLNGLSELTTVSSESNRLEVKKLRSMVLDLKISMLEARDSIEFLEHEVRDLSVDKK